MRCFVFLILSLCTFSAQAQHVIHVNAAAPEGGDGSSWSTAFSSLQDALAAADGGDTLWVAQGRYRPDDGAGITLGDRDAVFTMKEDLQLLGGFHGDETRSDARDPALYETVLTGDLLGNDSETDSLYAEAPSRQDNAYGIIYVPENVAGVYLAGVTIRDASGRDANGGFAIWSRGGLVMEDAVVTRNAGFTSIRIVSDLPHRFARMAIHDNVGGDGGAMGLAIDDESLHITLDDVVIRDNRAARFGGGIALYNANISLDISNCRFEHNTAVSGGGAIYSGETNGARMRVYNTVFARNESGAWGGGAILAVNLSMDIANTVFVGNRAGHEYDELQGEGGAIYIFESDGLYTFDDTTRIINSTFYGNVAEWAGASIFFQRSTRTLIRNSLFAGGAVTGPSNPDFEGTTELATWVPSWYSGIEERTEFSHTLAVGGFPYFATDLGGNLDADPGLCNPYGPDGITGTSDDDLHLCPGSAAIDAGDKTLLPADVLDLDADTDTSEPLPVDFDGRRRVFSTSGTPRVDIGAFEANAPLVAAEPNEQRDAHWLSVRLYPNPVHGVATLRVAPAAGLGTIAVFDVLGREVLRLDESAFMQATYRFDTAALPSGLYFVRVSTNVGSATTPLTVLR